MTVQWVQVGGPSKKRVVLRAPIASRSGYGTHSRQLARFLLSRSDLDVSFQIVPWGQTPWHLRREDLGGLIGRAMDRSGDQGPWDVSFQIQLPSEWDPRLAKTNVGVSAVVETDRCNPKWVDCANAMSLVVVPSSHARTVLSSSGQLRVPVAVVGESFPEGFSPVASGAPIDLGDLPEFCFLIVGQITGDKKTDRKDAHRAVRWLCEEFVGDPSVGVVVKTNCARDTRIDRNVSVRFLREACDGARKDGYPRAFLVHGTMTDGEMLGLYRHPSVRAFVTTTRGEGFGLPILEAAACGLPVVAPQWSGHMDFMGMGRFVKLAHRLVEIPDVRADGEIFVKGARWADCDAADFKKKVKRLRESYATPSEWAAALAVRIAERFSPVAIDAAWAAVLRSAGIL